MSVEPCCEDSGNTVSAVVPTRSNTLVLAPHLHEQDKETCLDLLTSDEPAEENILTITFREGVETKVDRWDQMVGTQPNEFAVVDMDVMTRSMSSRTQGEKTDNPSRPTVRSISNPSDLSTLRQEIRTQLSNWEDNDARTAVCFQSLTMLREYVEDDELFRFLHTILSDLDHFETIAHFHLDPNSVEESAITTIEPFFDAVVRLSANETGVKVTTRKQREQDLERHRSLVNHSSDMLLVLDEQGRVTYQSPVPAAAFEYEPRDLVGDSPEEYIHPEDKDALVADFEQLIRNPDEVVISEYRIETVDGQWRWCENRAQNFLDNPLIDGVLVSIRDITDRKEHEQELKRQRDRLDEFASVISHDLRNPLNVASGRLELAQSECESPHLSDASDALERIEEMIDDLLMLARQGNTINDTEAVSIADLVNECWQRVETARATIETPTTLTIDADRSRFAQLLENLIGNTVEHSGDEVSVTVGDLKNSQGFYIEDDGDGIPDDMKNKIFESGFSTSEDGTGFGLAIVREISEAHGWDIRVTDSEEGGARFEITAVEKSKTSS